VEQKKVKERKKENSMPAKSKQQFKFMKAVENNPEFAKKVGIDPEVAAEFTKGNKGKKRFAKLKEKVSGKK
jgi:hypothetical protein